MTDQQISINFEQILSSPETVFAPVTKHALRLVRAATCIVPGDFFKELSTEELDDLGEMIEGAQDDDSFSIQNLLLISHALAQSEGIMASSEEEMTLNVNNFMAMIMFVSLHRRGLVDLNYKKLTFGEELNDADVVSLKKGVSREDFLEGDEED